MGCENHSVRKFSPSNCPDHMSTMQMQFGPDRLHSASRIRRNGVEVTAAWSDLPRHGFMERKRLQLGSRRHDTAGTCALRNLPESVNLHKGAATSSPLTK